MECHCGRCKWCLAGAVTVPVVDTPSNQLPGLAQSSEAATSSECGLGAVLGPLIQALAAKAVQLKPEELVVAGSKATPSNDCLVEPTEASAGTWGEDEDRWFKEYLRRTR